MKTARVLHVLFAVALVASCGGSGSHFDASDASTGGAGGAGGSGGSGTGTADDGGPLFGGPDGGGVQNCTPNGPDLDGCPCSPAGTSRACYSGPPKTRNVGTCKDGAQTCTKTNGEFAAWGPCTGEVTPGPPSCTGTVDTDCNGAAGCADPSCASNPACQTGCTDGQTRPCYDGPSGTENVGVCKDGTQTCVNGQWSQACNGEVTPQPVNCCDAIDHACNYLPGCLNLFACITAPCCQTTCNSSNVDPGCVCPQGSGDTATCPQGDHDVHKGGFPGTDECCPCTTNDCGDPNCCGETVCAGSSACAGLNCNPLPASCNGQVSADCDDFPEDCDEPCCECSNCP